MEEIKTTRYDIRLTDNQIKFLEDIANREMIEHHKTKPIKIQKILYVMLYGLMDNEQLTDLVLKDYWTALSVLSK